MRFALGIEYDGGGFSGWQRLERPGEPSKRSEPTVQAALEEALNELVVLRAILKTAEKRVPQKDESSST